MTFHWSYSWRAPLCSNQEAAPESRCLADPAGPQPRSGRGERHASASGLCTVTILCCLGRHWTRRSTVLDVRRHGVPFALPFDLAGWEQPREGLIEYRELYERSLRKDPQVTARAHIQVDLQRRPACILWQGGRRAWPSDAFARSIAQRAPRPWADGTLLIHPEADIAFCFRATQRRDRNCTLTVEPR